MDLNKFFQSQLFKGALSGIAAFIMILLVFKIGMIVGIKKADFSCRWSDNYHQNFGGPKGGLLKGFGDKDFMEANGTFGQIIKIDSATLVIKGSADTEKIILVNEATTIKSRRETIKLTDLKIDDYIVTIGEPNNQGQIAAKLIRLMPALPLNAAAPLNPLPPTRPR